MIDEGLGGKMATGEPPREGENPSQSWSPLIEPDLAALGAWIRSNRVTQGINQRELADRAGLSRSYVSDIEIGRGVRPSLDTLDKLASGLGAARTDVLRAAGYLSPSRGHQAGSGELRLVRLYRDMNPENQAIVERFVQFIHAEEFRWSQASFIDENADHGGFLSRSADQAQGGPTLFDMLTEPAADAQPEPEAP